MQHECNKRNFNLLESNLIDMLVVCRKYWCRLLKDRTELVIGTLQQGSRISSKTTRNIYPPGGTQFVGHLILLENSLRRFS